MASSFDFSNIDYEALRKEYGSRTDSWISPPIVDDKTLLYFKMIENVYRVIHADGKWRFIELQPHQQIFHSKDLALLGSDAKTSIVVKSRNTSFTTDAIIRLFNSFYEYKRNSPVIRINEQKIKEIISEMSIILKHMRPIKMPNGSLYPFNPNNVDVSATKIVIKDYDISIIGYTSASEEAAENIRGNRSNTGTLDEINFAAYWDTIWGAMNGANPGSDKEGRTYFQVTLGTTLRGRTPFYDWYQKIIKEPELMKAYEVLEFPVFDPKVFNPDINPLEQPLLKPICFWHNMNKLATAWLEDKDKFMEEYMCVIAPTEGAFFDMREVIAVSTLNDNISQAMAQEYVSKKTVDDYRNMGIDCAGDGTDYFSISIINYNRAKKEYEHVYQYNVQKVKDPDEMVNFILDLYKSFNCYKIRIDANDLGYFIAQKLKNQLGSIVVESIRGAVRVKNSEISVPVKEFTLNHLVKQIRTGKIKLINDELVLKHFTMWKKDYSCERSKYDGHGDSVDAIGLACLPLQWRIGVIESPNYDFASQLENKEVKNNFGTDLKTRIDFYRKNKSRI